MKTSVLGAVLAAIALCTSVHAATPVALMTPVSFDPSTDKREEVKTECKLGEMIETHVGNALRRANKGPGTTTSMDGSVLKVTVTTIWGARGNNWTGPKGLLIRADLFQDGKLDRSIDLHRTTLGGIMGPFMGICGFMERDVKTLADDVQLWLRDPKLAPEQTPAPPREPAASASDAAK